jgi:hypothetical protein
MYSIRDSNVKYPLEVRLTDYCFVQNVAKFHLEPRNCDSKIFLESNKYEWKGTVFYVTKQNYF